MSEKEVKVGSKGQVVIPHTMRKALKISPGSKIKFRLNDGRIIIEKPDFDAVATLTKIAKQINYNQKMNSHQYEEELEERKP